MLSVGDLDILDLYDWLGSQSSVGDLLGHHQSTVSRRLVVAHQTFDLGKPPEWADQREGMESKLLELERRVHQHRRFILGEGLRLQRYRYALVLSGSTLPPGWSANPWEVPLSARDPIALLADSVLDALLAPYPLIKDLHDPELEAFPVCSLPLHLLVSRDCPLARETGLTATDVASTTAADAFEDIPAVASACVLGVDQQLFGAKASDRNPQHRRFWGSRAIPLLNPSLTVLDFELPVRHKEFLVVRREWSQHTQIQQLLEHLCLAMKQRHQQGTAPGAKPIEDLQVESYR
ncbi:MAG: hypothetical protein VKI42_05230 [Synechococcaceae cyanobacterium]|nr:hypothetical protein [Synechococcaceae cyanobacterium]